MNVARLAAVERDRERRRPPAGERAQRPVGVDEVAAHEPRLVGDPVGVGVKAAARDPDERPLVRPRRGRARARRPTASTAHAARGSSGIPSTRAKSLPRPPGRTPSTPSVCLSASATAPTRPSPPNATAVSPRGGRRASELARVLEAARALDVVLEPELGERGLHVRGQRVAGPSAAGRWVDDQRRASASPSTQRVEVVGDRHRRRVARRPRACGRVVTPVSTIARVEPGGGRPGQIGVEPVADRPACARGRAGRARSLKICGSGLPTIRARCARSRTRARRRPRRSRARSRPRSGKVRSRPAAIISAPAEHRLGGVAQLAEVEARRDRRRRRRRPRLARSVPLTIRWPGIGDVAEDRGRADHVGAASGARARRARTGSPRRRSRPPRAKPGSRATTACARTPRASGARRWSRTRATCPRRAAR